jgi:YaiO family outer membrane protein
MNRYKLLFITAVIISSLSFPAKLFSQQITDPESEYLRIRSLAFEGKYDFAASAARILINEYPGYGDARILLGRILAWKKDYKQALAVIDTLLQTEPDNPDALSAKRDISQWSKGSTPVATDIRAGYSFDTFSEPNNRFWQVFNAGAGHRFGWGPAVAGINIGNINISDTASIHKTELQFVAEAWPTLTNKNYAYVAYAFSPGIYFPKHRAAVEIWQMLPDGWAISAGLNYYYFTRHIFIAGLSVEKYISKYWFSAKGFVYFKDNGPTTSFFLNARRYFNNTDYLQAGIGAGTAPDEPFDVQTDLMRLSAYSFRLTGNVALTNKLTLRAGAGYSREEHAEDAWRNRFEGNINFIYALKMK